MSAYFLNPAAPRTVQWNEYPSNVPLKGKLRHWKHFKNGIILDHPQGGRCFHFRDSRGKQTFIALCPDLEFQL